MIFRCAISFTFIRVLVILWFGSNAFPTLLPLTTTMRSVHNWNACEKLTNCFITLTKHLLL